MASKCCGRTCEPPACYQRSEKLQKLCGWAKQNLLLVTTLVAVILGYIIGLLLHEQGLSDTTLLFIGFPGELFLRLLQMLVLPLMISSIMTGTTALDPQTNGRMALVTVAYFLVTSFISAVIGIVLVVCIHPGDPDIKNTLAVDAEDHVVSMLDTFLDLIRNAIPENVVQACINQVETKYVWVESGFKIEDATKASLLSNETVMDSLTTLAAPMEILNASIDVGSILSSNETMIGGNGGLVSTTVIAETLELVRKRKVAFRPQMNGLGLIVFFMSFGMILSNMKDKAVVLVEYFVVLDKIIMRLVKAIIWLTPLGVGSLICERMAAITNLSHIVEHMGMYIVTVLMGLFIHQFILLPTLYVTVIRKSPFRFWWNVFQAFLTGFATESSAAALPFTIQCMEENNKADPRVTKFVLPVGATINMNGTAMFVAIASIFIAQMNALEPSIAEIIAIAFTATAVSVASSATPSASLFLMVMTLSVLPKIPISDVSLLFAIDWFLGRCRTTNNIVGDCYAVAVIQHFYGKVLDEHRSELDQNRKDHTVPGIGLMYD